MGQVQRINRRGQRRRQVNGHKILRRLPECPLLVRGEQVYFFSWPLLPPASRYGTCDGIMGKEATTADSTGITAATATSQRALGQSSPDATPSTASQLWNPRRTTTGCGDAHAVTNRLCYKIEHEHYPGCGVSSNSQRGVSFVGSTLIRVVQGWPTTTMDHGIPVIHMVWYRLGSGKGTLNCSLEIYNGEICEQQLLINSKGDCTCFHTSFTIAKALRRGYRFQSSKVHGSTIVQDIKTPTFRRE